MPVQLRAGMLHVRHRCSCQQPRKWRACAFMQVAPELTRFPDQAAAYAGYLCSVVNLRLGDPEAALQPLKKLHTLLPDQPEVRPRLRSILKVHTSRVICIHPVQAPVCGPPAVACDPESSAHVCQLESCSYLHD
jgi:hypothetical protein